MAELGHPLFENRSPTVAGSDAAFGAIKFAAKLCHDAFKADRHQISANVLVGAVMVGGAVRACLRQQDGAGGLAPWAA
jgi:hypothetical protein